MRLCKRDIPQTRSTCTPQVRQKITIQFFSLEWVQKVKYFAEGMKEGKEKLLPKSHYKKKNLLYPAEIWDQAFELIVRNASLAPGEAKWTLERISKETGIPKSTLGHHFDEKKTTRKGRGHIAGGRHQSKVLSKGKRDFLTVLATKTCVIGKRDQCLACFFRPNTSPNCYRNGTRASYSGVPVL